MMEEYYKCRKCGKISFQYYPPHSWHFDANGMGQPRFECPECREITCVWKFGEYKIDYEEKHKVILEEVKRQCLAGFSPKTIPCETHCKDCMYDACENWEHHNYLEVEE